MPISRYPRRGHPIAPSVLAPFLRRKSPEIGIRLDELDADCWGKYGEATCRRLGKTVVSHLARQVDDIIRVLGACHIAPAASKIGLSDLDLEVRTCNCLERIDVDQRHDGLGDLTIREVLEIQSFGIKSLVDLLTSIEAVFGEERTVDLCSKGAAKTEVCSPLPRGICDVIRRSGHVPSALADINVPAPPPGVKLDEIGLRERTVTALRKAGFARDPTAIGKLTLRQAIRIVGLGTESLCELIEGVERAVRSQQRRFTAKNLGRDEARIILEVVCCPASLPGWVLASVIPPIPAGVHSDALGLQRRTRNVLERERLFDLSSLSQATIGDLCKLKGFGRSCVIDLLARVCHVRASRNFGEPAAGSAIRDVYQSIEAICVIPGAENINAKDPRCGRLLRRIHGDVETIGQLSRHYDDPSVFGQAEHVKALRDAIVRCTTLTIESELMEILVRRDDLQRNQQMIAEHYGFGGGSLGTLEMLGNRYGVTRERVRQICAPSRISKLPSPPFAPVLDAALVLIRDSLPEMGSSLERMLVNQRMLNRGTTLESIERVAHVLRRETGFELIGPTSNQFALHKTHAKRLKKIEQTSRKLVSRYGAAVIPTYSSSWREEMKNIA